VDEISLRVEALVAERAELIVQLDAWQRKCEELQKRIRELTIELAEYQHAGTYIAY
jgi:predicted nuclease with TOPRIM domain